MEILWYSRKLIANSTKECDELVPNFVRPLVEMLDQNDVDFRFHFFRYSGPPPFLRLRIRGDESVIAQVEAFEEANLSRLGSKTEPEPYGTSSELGHPFQSEEDVEEAWRIYELASRIAMECAGGRFLSQRLRADNAVGVKLNHLFLNSVGYNIADEYNVHMSALRDRAVVLLMARHNLSESEVWSRFDDALSAFDQAIGGATATLQRALS